MARNGWNLFGLNRMAGNGFKRMKLSGNVRKLLAGSGWAQLDMKRNIYNCWKWLEKAGKVWKCLKGAVNGCKLLEMLEMAGMAGNA